MNFPCLIGLIIGIGVDMNAEKDEQDGEKSNVDDGVNQN